MKALVTGAGGFLGTSLTGWLSAHNDFSDVRGVVRSQPGAPVAGVTYGQTIEAADLMFHLAGKGGIPESFDDPAAAMNNHALPAIEAIDAAWTAGVKTLVMASSCAVYGTHDGAAVEDKTPLRPASPYGVAKLAIEAYAGYAHRTRGQDIRIARIGNPYGPGQRRLVIHDLATRALSDGGPLKFRGSGEEIRDFIHVKDCAKALAMIGLNGKPGNTYNVGSGQVVKIREIATLIADAAGLGAEAVSPSELAEAGKVSIAYPDISRLAALGFTPGVNLEDGIREVVEWVRKTL